MAGYTDYLERAFLNHIFTDPAWTPPTSLYLLLFTGAPSDDAGAGLTEVSGSGYVRQETTAADWGASTGTAPATKSNTATKAFPVASASYAGGANLTYFGIADAASGGNLLAVGQLAVAKPVLTGDTPTFPAGSLVLKQGDPGDTF